MARLAKERLFGKKGLCGCVPCGHFGSNPASRAAADDAMTAGKGATVVMGREADGAEVRQGASVGAAEGAGGVEQVWRVAGEGGGSRSGATAAQAPQQLQQHPLQQQSKGEGEVVVDVQAGRMEGEEEDSGDGSRASLERFYSASHLAA